MDHVELGLALDEGKRVRRAVGGHGVPLQVAHVGAFSELPLDVLAGVEAAYALASSWSSEEPEHNTRRNGTHDVNSALADTERRMDGYGCGSAHKHCNCHSYRPPR